MLVESLKIILASQYAFVIKAQFFHWNVEGPDFAQLHDFFGKIYEEVYGNGIDRCAEFIRVLDDYTPGSFERFAELSVISGQIKVPRARLMLEELLQDSNELLAVLNTAFQEADTEQQQGVADFLAERIDAQGKHSWMLRSFLKEARA